MCCMCLLIGSPKILVHMIGIGGWLHLKSCWVHTHDKELFCRRLVTGDKTWIYHKALLSKLEFMPWKNVDRPTFTRICKSAVNWLDYGNIFLGYRRTADDRLKRQLLVSFTQNQHSSYWTS